MAPRDGATGLKNKGGVKKDPSAEKEEQDKAFFLNVIFRLNGQITESFPGESQKKSEIAKNTTNPLLKNDRLGN